MAHTVNLDPLHWGVDVETFLPGYAITQPSLRLGGPTSKSSTVFDLLWDEVERRGCRPGDHVLAIRTIVAKAYTRVPPHVRPLLGGDSPFEELGPWQVLRFLIFLVCGGARYDLASWDVLQALLDGGAGKEARKSRAWSLAQGRFDVWTMRWDNLSCATLFAELLSPGDTPLVCRHYVRLIAELFAALRPVLPGGENCFLIPVSGSASPWSNLLHAWCLYVDRRRHVATVLDPTAADSVWDAGVGRHPFNPSLDGRSYCTASAFYASLIARETPTTADALSVLLGALDSASRVHLATRVLGQYRATWVLRPREMGDLLVEAERRGAPEGLVDHWRIKHFFERPEDGFPDETYETHAASRARLAWFLVRAGLVEEEALPSTLRGDYEACRAGLDNRSPALPRIGRNAPCPCGSGKKYKRCCRGKREFIRYSSSHLSSAAEPSSKVAGHSTILLGRFCSRQTSGN